MNEEQQRPDAVTKGCLTLAAIPLLLIGGCTVWAMAGGGDDPDSNNEYEAKAQCEGFVDKRLKAPGSADYDLSASRSGASWTVTGTVDSENSFGANLRSSVRCVIHFEGDTAYLDDISVG